jgi:hypothetical protein
MRRSYVLLILVACAVGQTPAAIPTIFIISGADAIPKAIEKHFAQECPSVVKVTHDAAAATYVLHASMKQSTLTTGGGQLLYETKALHSGNIAKDVCKYLADR